jgi:hypothetical protein
VNDQSYVSLSGALAEAQAAKTANANCVMHLFQSGFTPTPQSTLADFLAQEATYDGYASETIPTWADPVLAGVAYAIFAPTQIFRWVFASAGTGNMIGGYFIVTSGGSLKSYTVFGTPIPMESAGQAVIKTPVEVYPAG